MNDESNCSYPKKFIQEVDQYFQNPVQRSKAVDINTDVSKVTDLEYNRMEYMILVNKRTN